MCLNVRVVGLSGIVIGLVGLFMFGGWLMMVFRCIVVMWLDS